MHKNRPHSEDTSIIHQHRPPSRGDSFQDGLLTRRAVVRVTGAPRCDIPLSCIGERRQQDLPVCLTGPTTSDMPVTWDHVSKTGPKGLACGFYKTPKTHALSLRETQVGTYLVYRVIISHHQ